MNTMQRAVLIRAYDGANGNRSASRAGKAVADFTR
jgi:hypothetical protein